MNIAINGLGRIGRCALKILIERINAGAAINVVAVNDLASIENLAYLLKYDSVYGVYDKKVGVESDGFVIDGTKYRVVSEKDPTKLPWKDLSVDVVIECTGLFTDGESSKQHITAGAKKVLISAPAKGDDVATYVFGSKEFTVDSDIISNASCTTNSVTPVLSIIDAKFGIEKAMLTTVHALTASQGLVDGPNKKDLREGRSGHSNMVPTSTGAAKATAKALTQLKDIFDGVSVRVPVICGSLSDLTILTKKSVTVEDVNNAFIEEQEKPLYKGILKFTKAPLVSGDILKTPFSCIVDGEMTRVVGGNLVKVMAWYDNEWGYTNRLVDMAIKACEVLKTPTKEKQID